MRPEPTVRRPQPTLAAGLAALALISVATVSGAAADKQVVRGSVASTLAEAELRSEALSVGPVQILLLSDPLVAGPGETASGRVSAGLVKLAERTGLIVAVPIVEQPDGPAGDRQLALALVTPGQSVLVQGYAARPVVPIAGVAFARDDFRDPSNTVDIGGFPVGIAAIGDGDLAIPRLSDRGAALILLTGGPVGKAQVERFAQAARANRVALLIAGRCTGAPSCIASAAVDADGKVDWSGARSHDFARLPRWSPPSANGLPNAVPQPSRYDYSPALAELGRILFFDPRISDTGTVACASCHAPSLGFADGRALGAGVHGRSTGRNVVSLLNVAFRPVLRWDGYASPLENFIRYPMSGRDEMDSHDLDQVAGRIGRSAAYRAQFTAVFGTDRVRFEMVEQALAGYMRTLVSGNSPFDRAMIDGRREAMTESARRGYALFDGRAGCAGCHSYSEQSPFFTDFQAHNTGLDWDASAARYRDTGAGAIGTAAHAGRFRTPTLRDVARTGPYMHNGSLATLRDVIDYFDRGGGDGPARDPQLRALHLSERDKQDLEAFLIALTGTTTFDKAGRRTNP